MADWHPSLPGTSRLARAARAVSARLPLVERREDDTARVRTFRRVAGRLDALPRPARGGKPRVLLLQGPVGPFFDHLSDAFVDRGYAVDRVRFNGADHVMARAPREGRLLSYAKGETSVGAWFRATLTCSRYDLVVLFGCQRPAHVAAAEVARECGVPVVSLEEGYIRTGLVTVELDANNAGSPIAGDLPDHAGYAYADPPTVRPNKAWMSLHGGLYFTLRNLLTFGKGRELFHKRRPLISEGWSWLRSGLRWSVATLHDAFGESVVHYVQRHHRNNYDVVILQVCDDAQMTVAARGWTNERLIHASIESFARFAPRDRCLVFKVHPNERGHTSDHRLIEMLAERWGVADRVRWIYTGPLSTLAAGARGMIVINSTSGISAIDKGCPLLVLGEAIYANPELVRIGDHERAIDAFWTDDHVASPELRRAYRGWLTERTMVEGDYYARAFLPLTASNVAERAIALAKSRSAAVGTGRSAEVVRLPRAA